MFNYVYFALVWSGQDLIAADNVWVDIWRFAKVGLGETKMSSTNINGLVGLTDSRDPAADYIGGVNNQIALSVVSDSGATLYLSTLDIVGFLPSVDQETTFSAAANTKWEKGDLDVSSDYIALTRRVENTLAGDYDTHNLVEDIGDITVLIDWWVANDVPGASSSKRVPDVEIINRGSGNKIFTVHYVDSETNATLDNHTLPVTPIPEFSTWALMLALVVVISGFAVMKYKKKF